MRDTRRSSKTECRARCSDARPAFAKASGLAGHFSRREYRCQPGRHRPGCGGSTPPSRRVRVASIAVMQRSLKPQSTGQHRGDPPSFALSQHRVGSERKIPSVSLCEGERTFIRLRASDGRPFCRCGSAATAVPQPQDKLPGALPHESANLSIGSISASVVKL